MSLNTIAGDIKTIITELVDQYSADDRPWIVGFSGGKDSTTLLQLVFYALKKIPAKQLTKEIHILCNDTLVENPAIVRFVDGTLDKIQAAGNKYRFPLKVVKTTPALADSFWVNLIGKGYPSPTRVFRWCTERMKIKPANTYIQSVVGKYGEAIILLGTRKAESTNRARSMSLHEREGQRLRRHLLPGVYAYTPIADLTDDQIWTYLLSVPSPWGSDNRKLFTLYRNASGGECPLVIDTSTPSCGNSRFGCWVCTVVEHDKSMEGLIETGEDWMEPMLEFRDWLKEARDRDDFREKERRDGSEGPGPFTKEARIIILKQLLKVQKQIGLTLITEDELSAIQWLWHHDYRNAPVVADIYREIIGEESSNIQNPIIEKRREERDILERICAEEGIPSDLVEQLIQIEKDKSGLMRRHGLFQDMDSAIGKYLRSDSKDAHI